jgi:peptidoglycan endopeptidase LytE
MRKHLLAAAATASILFASFGGAASAQDSIYTVKSGDTLWKISQATGVSVANLKAWNNLTSDMIYVNQNLALVAPAVSKGQAIITEAKKYIGTPYLWGGSTPAGFDCSGYVQYVYGKVGLSIPRTTSTQWTGLKVISTPRPGDLVFFNTSGSGVSHVGIYLGNNQFIHAGSTGVIIADMSTSYWAPKYLGARAAY